MDRLNYKVKTIVFEGPLDLLLDLVEKRKQFVSDVSLAAVT
ncbi:MAG: Segregation and condensation protein, partial [Parcubacteria group bacterium]|nr:Segregation and condensation protein [Parcubacteria group bacterium]